MLESQSEASARSSAKRERQPRPSYSLFVFSPFFKTVGLTYSQDEIDALAASRSADTDSGAGSHEGVLTSLLNEMDGVQELLGVTVVAATNRPDVIVSLLSVSPEAIAHRGNRTRH